MDELRREGEGVGSCMGDGGGFGMFGYGRGGEDRRRGRRLGNRCGPRIGLVQAEGGFGAAVVVIGVDVKNLLVGAGQGSSRRGGAGLVRWAF